MDQQLEFRSSKSRTQILKRPRVDGRTGGRATSFRHLRPHLTRKSSSTLNAPPRPEPPRQIQQHSSTTHRPLLHPRRSSEIVRRSLLAAFIYTHPTDKLFGELRQVPANHGMPRRPRCFPGTIRTPQPSEFLRSQLGLGPFPYEPAA